MASHIFHKLVYSVRSNTKIASWSFCVSVFDSSGQPAASPGVAFACIPGGFGCEFEVGRATSCVEVLCLVQNLPMGFASNF